MNNHLQNNLTDVEKNYRGIRKLVLKIFHFLLRPYMHFQNSINEKVLKENGEFLERIQRLENEKFPERIQKLENGEFLERIQKLERDIEESVIKFQNISENQKSNEKYFDKIMTDMGAVARQVMLVKWREIDNHIGDTESEEDILTCKICGFSQMRGKYETKETDCRFNGGHLIRYICPQCGVIFGPTKFLSQGQKGIDEDYWVHYLGFSEGDSSYKEMRAFHMLNPVKEGIYLNYGCGHWSKSLQNLREEGYQVYGYEPYSADMDNPYMITSKDELMKMRFDGIYSNDLLEHLINPVEDLKFMSSLLFGPESKMSHCTLCYIYKYEFTRFHTHFFTGDSVKYLTKNSGLKIVDYCDDMKAKDFICYVYAVDRKNINFINDMKIKCNGKRLSDGLALENKGIMYGPYFTLPERSYVLHIEIEGETENTNLCINSDCGVNVFYQGQLQSGDNRVEFYLESLTDSIEFVVENEGGPITITSIYFE